LKHFACFKIYVPIYEEVLEHWYLMVIHTVDKRLYYLDTSRTLRGFPPDMRLLKKL